MSRKDNLVRKSPIRRRRKGGDLALKLGQLSSGFQKHLENVPRGEPTAGKSDPFYEKVGSLSSILKSAGIRVVTKDPILQFNLQIALETLVAFPRGTLRRYTDVLQKHEAYHARPVEYVDNETDLHESTVKESLGAKKSAFNSQSVEELCKSEWKAISHAMSRPVFKCLLSEASLFKKINLPGRRTSYMQLTGINHPTRIPNSAAVSDKKNATEQAKFYKNGIFYRRQLPDEIDSHWLKLESIFPRAFGFDLIPNTDEVTGPPKKFGRKLPRTVFRLIKSTEPWYQKLVSRVQKFTANNCAGFHLIKKYSGPNSELGADREWSSHDAVYRFLDEFIRTCFPHDVLGSVDNWNALSRGLRLYVNAGCWDELQTNDFLSGISVLQIKWLGRSSSVQESRQKRDLLAQFVYWVYAVLCPLIIKRYFYVTMLSGSSTQFRYFRHPVWTSIKNRVIKEFKAPLMEVPADHDPRGPYRIRVMPKSAPKSYRVIVKLGKMGDKYRTASNALSVVGRQYKDQLPSHNDLLPMLDNFRNQNPQGPYFAVVVDIKEAFDTLHVNKLTAILDKHKPRALTESWLRFSKILSTKYAPYGGTQKIFGLPEAGLTDIFSGSKSMSLICQGNIVHQTTVGNALSQIDVEWLLKKLPLLIGDRKFYKASGIPQGSPISKELYDLHASDLMATHFAHLLESPKCLLVRYVDDILLVSTDRTAVCSFTDEFRRGFPEYGVTIKDSKIQSNVERPLTNVKYLGFEINLENLQLNAAFNTFYLPRAALKSYKSLKRAVSKGLQSHTARLRSFERLGEPVPLDLAEAAAVAFGKEVGLKLNRARVKWPVAQNIAYHALYTLATAETAGVRESRSRLIGLGMSHVARAYSI